MKIAKDSGRTLRLLGIGLAVLAATGTGPASAQQGAGQQYAVPPQGSRTDAGAKIEKDLPRHLNSITVPGVQQTRLPVSPSEPIALVNNQPITRRELADECVAKEGKKVLDVMINRLLIEQALARRNLSVTAMEVDAEIEAIAQRFGITRQGWLRTLDKERGISPAQYAREIVYPALALRKLCNGRVQVTPKDLQEAFEAHYGDKLRCRMILVDNQGKAIQIWEQLRKNPGGFENVAKTQSMDPGTRSLGGLLPDPITRHAIPRNLSDSAFQQLVDGDPADHDPSHKPKDGEITGPIEAAGNWVILRREELIPAPKNVSLKDERVRQNTYDMIYEVKLKEAMEDMFQQLIKEAAIENRLTGAIKMANEERDPDYRVDGDVKLMGNKGNGGDGDRDRDAAPAAGASAKIPPPAALSPDAMKQFRPLKPGGNPAAAPAAQPAGSGQ